MVKDRVRVVVVEVVEHKTSKGGVNVGPKPAMLETLDSIAKSYRKAMRLSQDTYVFWD